MIKVICPDCEEIMELSSTFDRSALLTHYHLIEMPECEYENEMYMNCWSCEAKIPVYMRLYTFI